MAVIKIVPMPGVAVAGPAGPQGPRGYQGDTGLTGPQGASGTNGAPGQDGADALWNYTGEYSGGASYAVGDIATYDGQLWYRVGANGGNVGDTPSPGFWNLLAAKGADGSQLNYWDGATAPQDPAQDGFLIVDGIVTGLNSNLLVSASDRVFIGGNNGEFLNGLSTPENQIATLGDIESVDTLSNGLVVTGQIDDPTINPSGTMSLSVQDGYTALMDLIASAGTFNGNVYITNLGNDKTTIIETPTEVNNTLTVTGDLVSYGISRYTPGSLSVSSSDNVLITGNNGEFLNDPTNPENQIATIGDISNAAPVETSFTVNGGTLGTQPTFDGAPLFSGTYVINGPMVHFQIQVDMDNITSFGTGQYYVDLPFPAKYGYQFKEGCLHDISSGKQYAIGGHVYAGQSQMALTFTNSAGQDEPFDYNSPVVLATTDNFHISGTYISE
jgi:hypothetical protein